MGLVIARNDDKDWFHIGYGAFFHLRKAIGEQLGYQYSADNMKILIPDNEDQSITEFLLHSDCDGTLEEETIKHLWEAIKNKKIDNPKIDEFKKFTKQSVIDGATWIFA